jgi:multidrug efflux pump subunit AcrA (membrane-fusion protein)
MSRVHLGSLSAAGLLVSCLCLQGSAAWKTIDESPSTTATDSAGVRYLELPMLARAAAEAKVPALERGGLRSIDLAPGVQAKTGAQLASLEDREAALMVELAERDLEAARQKYKASKQIEIATAAVEEGRQHLEEATEEAEAAEQQAADETPVQLVRKLEELAADRLERARVSREQSERSIPASEWFTLQNELDQSRIRTTAAVQQRSVAALRARAARSLVERQRVSLQKLELQLLEARADREEELLQQRNLETALEIARARLERRRLAMPFDGVVVEQFKQTGEWCEAGEAVLRVLQLNPLHLEGFAPAHAAAFLRPGLRIRARLITPEKAGTTTKQAPAESDVFTAEGKLIFVSPEVDALNRQVRIRAEIANPDQRLRPGENLLMNVALTE